MGQMGRRRFLQYLAAAASFYVAFLLLCELPFVSRRTGAGADSVAGGGALISADAMLRRVALGSEEETQHKSAPARPSKLPYELPWASSSAPIGDDPSPVSPRRRSPIISGLVLNATVPGRAFSEFSKSVMAAWQLGRKVLDGLRASAPPPAAAPAGPENRKGEDCPKSIVTTGAELLERGRMLLLPCGLTLGSHITLVARPRAAHAEYDPKILSLKEGDGPAMVSQFMMELLGLRAVDGEEPPRILHFNPRLKGDWSGRPVIEQNTCYRQQWATSQRCDGSKSKPEEEAVDGMVKCEKWRRDDDDESEEDSNSTWWVNRFIRQPKRPSLDWAYPFVEDKLFVLTLRAGLEGFHINVDGRHVTSFPYRTGFGLEDATGFSLNGDLDVESIYAASLPTSHPSFAPQRSLEMSPQWQALPLPDEPVELFIGILSAGNHFAERMAVRKSWMSAFRKSSHVVARFFIALHGRKEVNVELKKEAEFFGDIVIVPYMDSYDLVVLKTIAICEYGVHTVSAKYIMKCDDDTFVRIGSIMREVNKIPSDESLYIGNVNYFHKPLRNGKWAVTPEEWPEEFYPPYANGPGYVISSDIARFIVSEFEKNELRLFKMEDVSMGMWVEQFNSSRPVTYIHSTRFCQFGCIDGYYTAHYQSPRQMLCLWNKLRIGRPQCCNGR